MINDPDIVTNVLLSAFGLLVLVTLYVVERERVAGKGVGYYSRIFFGYTETARGRRWHRSCEDLLRD